MKAAFSFAVIVLLSCGHAWAGRAALVFLDMQPFFMTRNGMYTLPENIEKIRQVKERQGHLIQLAKKNRIPIIKIEYADDFDPDKYGETHPALTEKIGDYDLVMTFQKFGDGMFPKYGDSDRALLAYLDRFGIQDLIVAGANGDKCVKASIEGALEKGFRVIADSRSIIDFNPRNFEYPFRFEKNVFSSQEKISGTTFHQTEDLKLIDQAFKGSFKGKSTSSSLTCHKSQS